MAVLTKILRRNLKLDREVLLAEFGKQWRDRLSHLEIECSIFDLNYHVIVKLAIQGSKSIDCRCCAVAFPVLLINWAIDKSSIHYHAIVPLYRSGKEISPLR